MMQPEYAPALAPIEAKPAAAIIDADANTQTTRWQRKRHDMNFACTRRRTGQRSVPTTNFKRFFETVEQGLRTKMAAELELDRRGALTSR
jgi:hypothetical protein